ncbi:MAG: DUF4422 domain-containing protein [Eubacterium sp.]|nr:DUF4422 domain-containing protein [Eubacterium sp.]
MYVAAHKAFEPPKLQGYIPLQVGAALHEDLGYVRDDSGDNMSAGNPNWCELTGVYWIWKNVECDIVGLCHYRRYFNGPQGFLTVEDFERILDGCDVITGISSMPPDRDLYAQYDRKHCTRDIMNTREVIERVCPADLSAFDAVMNSRLISVGNMMVCRKPLFDDYCGWLFAVLKEVEKVTDLTGYDDYNKRIYGFISERLMRVYLMNRPLRVREIEIREV